MTKVECYCLFDISATGVTGHIKNMVFPMVTKTGLTINDQRELSNARNRQRNFDTILQLLGLRTQIFNITEPVLIENDSTRFNNHNKYWMFSFEIEPQAQWSVDGDDFWMLKQDSDGTPMIVGLGEEQGLNPVIDATSDNPNIIYYHD